MSDPTIDPATFAALEDMAGPEFADELVETFLEEAPGMLGDLRASVSPPDAERFRRAAHSLKSNSMTFGALALGALAKSLELGGIDASTPSALDALADEYARVAAALKALRHG